MSPSHCPTPPHLAFGFLGSLPRPLFLFLAWVYLSEPAIGQQAVRGRVLDGVDPVRGAMVVLLSGEEARSRVLTAEDGSFRISVPLPGLYTLRVDRIGYESTLSAPFEVPTGSTIERTILAQVRPVSLAAIEVEGARRCELRPEEGLATGRLWEEARKALDAAVWTIERDLYRFTWTKYERTVDASGRRVLAESRANESRLTPQPFRSLDASILAREGYVRPVGRELVYDAPDASVLLSDPFLDTHCFRLEGRRDDRGETLIGLRFEPIPGREQTDVAGVMWLTESGAVLRSLSYEYTSPNREVRYDEGGGELTFRGLPNGTWIVQEWRIRMPQLVEQRDQFGRVQSYRVESYRDEGGVVRTVARADGVLLGAVDRMATLRGLVTDSLGAPAVGVSVWLEGSAAEATTDIEGAFLFTEMLPGNWSVRASDPGLQSIGYDGTIRQVQLQGGTTASVMLALPSRRDIGLERCGGVRSDSTMILMGRVKDEAGAPVPGADVRALWTDVESTPTGIRNRMVRGRNTLTLDVQTTAIEQGLGTTSGSNGVFTLCSVPTAAELWLSASLGEKVSPAIALGPGSPADVHAVELVIAPRRSSW